MEKLYDKDSYIKDFSGVVISCEKCENGYKSILSQTAFFPQQGGQNSDRGKIGEIEVFDVQMENGEVVHYTKEELQTGKEYFCFLYWDERFRKMQIHTAEHIFSGVAHRLYGCENTGFHLDNTTTVDFDKILTKEQLQILELETNKAIWADKKIRAYYPDEKELENISYRSKKEVYDGKTRIVEIEDVDNCACCAPHLSSTGQVGIFKILSWMKHKGGIRITVVAGIDGYLDYVNKHDNTKEISNLLSTPQEKVFEGVEKLTDSFEEAKKVIFEKNNIIGENFVSTLPYKDGNIVVLFEEMNSNALINLANLGMEKCSGMFVLCYPAKDVLRYVIGSRNINLREKAKEINQNLKGKGGGSETMISGSFAVSFEEVEKYFK